MISTRFGTMTLFPHSLSPLRSATRTAPGARLPLLLLTLLIAGVILLAPRGAQAAPWYVPQESDFRPAYNADKGNQSAQSWQEYWGWVGTFYSGSLFADGWTQTAEGTIAGVKTPATWQQLQAQFNRLGRQIAQEWSKDNGHRKIDSNDLQQWFRQMQAAKASDNGNGQQIQGALRAIQQQVTAKLAR